MGDVALETARELIQEAKGADGPNGGFVTDHLDAAENWLDRVETELTALRSRVAVLEGLVARAADQFDYYGKSHRAKRTDDATAKAIVNENLAAELRAALTQEQQP